MKLYRDLFKVQLPKTRIEYSLKGQQIHLTLFPNASTLRGGVFFPKDGLRDLVEGFTFACECACGYQHGAVELDSQGFWKGWKSILDHGIRVHGIHDYGPFSLQLDFGDNKIKLVDIFD